MKISAYAPLMTGKETIEISLIRYDNLIKTEAKYEMIKDALEQEYGFVDIDALKKHLGITKKGSKTE